MTAALAFRRAALSCALVLAASPAGAQSWRQAATSIGTTARVLIVGTHPEDEDNALIAWLSLGRNVETAYLSITRGEAGVNLAGNERQSALGVVRTAELLAERQRDGARQYFTRAYDFGLVRSDSILENGWLRDTLLVDVVTIMRAFRPHVVISLFSDSIADRDLSHRYTARLTREAVRAAADSARFPARSTARLQPWAAQRVLMRLDAAEIGAVVADVGEFDRVSGKTFAELGAEIRRLQRSQRPVIAPAVGHVPRFFRVLEGASEEGAGLFGSVDTTWNRFRSLPPDFVGVVDSVARVTAEARAITASGASSAELTRVLARVLRRVADARANFPCPEPSGAPVCSGVVSDLVLSLNRIREQATTALTGAAGVVIDGTVSRELVAAGDSIPVTVRVYNGGTLPFTIRRLVAASIGTYTYVIRDSINVAPDSVREWTTSTRVLGTSLNWWQRMGLVPGWYIHQVPLGSVVTSEERMPTTGVEATVAIAGVDVPVATRPLAYRGPGAVRGEARRPLAGVTVLSILLEKAAEYERANLPIDRLMRVVLSSARTVPESASITLTLPKGLRADSLSKSVTLAPLGETSVFFRIRGTLKSGTDSIVAVARRAKPRDPAASPNARAAADYIEYVYGVLPRDYPHIPSQRYFRNASVRLESVDLRVPPRMNIAYVKGTDDVQTPLGQLHLKGLPIEAALIPSVDLSYYTAVLIGAGAMANDALTPAIPSLREFMQRGGVVVVMAGGDEVASSGLLPYPIAFDSAAVRTVDADIPLIAGKGTRLLSWPNAITGSDFVDWYGERARGVPIAYDLRYRVAVSAAAPGQPAVPLILAAPVGKGMVIYSPLSLDRQLSSVHPGAPKILVNLLSAAAQSAQKQP
jgi:LmbE family N-acetylglucosaminyl deacetylase